MTESILIGDPEDGNDNVSLKLKWINKTFNEDNYKITDIGWAWPEYRIRFKRAQDATLYKLRWE